MQCPNCGREAININGREICLDCGIEIARGVYDAKNELPKEQEETVMPSPQQTDGGASDSANVYETEKAASVATVDTQNIIAPDPTSEPTGFHPPELSMANREYSVPAISQLGESQGNESVPESAPEEEQVNAEDGEPTVDRLVLDSIEKKEDISPHIENSTDLIFDFQKNDNTGAKGITGAVSEVEKEVIDTREAAEKQAETPIFEDQTSGENKEVPEAVSSSPTLNEEILANEAYVEPKDIPLKVEVSQAAQEAVPENPRQVDSIQYDGAPMAVSQSQQPNVSNLGISQSQNSYDQTVDIMPAQGVSSGTYRKIAIIMIVLINIIAIASLGIFVNNKYFGGKDVETVQPEPVVTVE